MRRLYVRIYLALVASLAIFAVLAAIGWRVFSDRERASTDERAWVAEVAAALLPAADSPPDAQAAVLRHWHERTGADLALFDAGGEPIASAGRALAAPAQVRGGEVDAAGGGWSWRRWLDRGERDGRGAPAWSLRLPDGRWLVARAPRFRPPPAYGWGALLVALGVAVAIGAFPLVRRLTRRLEQLQRGVEALGAGDLSARVPVQGRDEVAALAASFNRSAGRIEALVHSQRSLLANASHELRSPLARLKMAAALLADDDGPDSAAQRAGLRDEVGRNVEELDALVDEILLASRLDAEAEIAREPVDLAALVAQSCARVDVPFEVQGDADGAGRAGGTGGADASAAWRTLRGDARLLRRLVGNLLDNARRHGAGPIEVVLRRVGDRAELDVMDRGPGVPEAERERIFEPFHRVAGHAESSGGTGLGLALVRQIAMRHGATAECLPREGGGTRMRVVFGQGGYEAHDRLRPTGKAFREATS